MLRPTGWPAEQDELSSNDGGEGTGQRPNCAWAGAGESTLSLSLCCECSWAHEWAWLKLSSLETDENSARRSAAAGAVRGASLTQALHTPLRQHWATVLPGGFLPREPQGRLKAETTAPAGMCGCAVSAGRCVGAEAAGLWPRAGLCTGRAPAGLCLTDVTSSWRTYLPAEPKQAV